MQLIKSKITEFLDVFLHTPNPEKLKRLSDLKEGDHERLVQLAKLRLVIEERERQLQLDASLQRLLLLKQIVFVSLAGLWGYCNTDYVISVISASLAHTHLTPVIACVLFSCTLYNPFNVSFFAGLKDYIHEYFSDEEEQVLPLEQVWACYEVVTPQSIADKIYEKNKIRLTTDEVKEALAMQLGCTFDEVPKQVLVEPVTSPTEKEKIEKKQEDEEVL